jgi:hypothetical protein
MVQTHGSIQLSMGETTLEGLIDADTSFSLRLLPDTEGSHKYFSARDIQPHGDQWK